MQLEEKTSQIESLENEYEGNTVLVRELSSLIVTTQQSTAHPPPSTDNISSYGDDDTDNKDILSMDITNVESTVEL